MPEYKTTPCEFCGKIPNEKARIYERTDILLQTPPEVWKEYKANGYTIQEAIGMERSYA
jgi:hypothetical protein